MRIAKQFHKPTSGWQNTLTRINPFRVYPSYRTLESNPIQYVVKRSTGLGIVARVNRTFARAMLLIALAKMSACTIQQNININIEKNGTTKKTNRQTKSTFNILQQIQQTPVRRTKANRISTLRNSTGSINVNG